MGSNIKVKKKLPLAVDIIIGILMLAIVCAVIVGAYILFRYYANDYETVSSVFHNRLNNADFPRLESDATIMYAIQVRDGERKSSLTGEDLKYNTPYNSYLYKGLPPGPIANPGYEAITCALWPAKTKYYYFVSDNYGNTYFSRTNAEHEAAKAKVAKINAGG